jgi:hypothetical protein
MPRASLLHPELTSSQHKEDHRIGTAWVIGTARGLQVDGGLARGLS